MPVLLALVSLSLVIALGCGHYHSGYRGYDFSVAPIISLGLPKSGTTSLKSFLNSLNSTRTHIHAVHYGGVHCPDSMFPIPAIAVENGVQWKNVSLAEMKKSPAGCYIALKIQRAIADGFPALEYLLRDGFNAFTQMEVADFGINIWPQIDLLNHILDRYPHAFFIHHVRNVKQHVLSILRWNNYGSRYWMDLQRLGMLSRFPGQNANNSVEENLRIFVIYSKNYIRQAFLARPGLRYLEVDIEGDLEAGEKLSIFLGAGRLSKMPHLNHNLHPVPVPVR